MSEDSGKKKSRRSAVSDVQRAYMKTQRDSARALRIAEFTSGQSAAVGGALRRLSEPSTYAGLAGMAAMLGINSDEWSGVSQILMIIFSALAVFMRERGDGL